MTAPTLHVAGDGAPVAGHPRRWATLAVMCLAVFVTVLDGSSGTVVALPLSDGTILTVGGGPATAELYQR